MQTFSLRRVAGIVFLAIFVSASNQAVASGEPAIVIHGGAGAMTKATLSPEREAAIRVMLETSVKAGYQVLLAGGSSTMAVTTAINILEDSPLFNAGRGAVFNADGINEMDASIMEGATMGAGAVASVRHIKNPINLALSVMNDSEHVMLTGEGAEAFARAQGFEMMDKSYFQTEHRRQQLQKMKEQEAAGTTAASNGPADAWFSTVGAVALDAQGNLAAGTSTGGMTNKRFGRVGDSPIIGAGTYANNASCAVSATGHGEYFIRYVVAYDICKRVELGSSLADATDAVINGVLKDAGGSGGVIAMDHFGNIATTFNALGMFRASVDAEGQLKVAIFGDDIE
ncbi:MAG: isoaspartyl peptidase/L-asparaginase, partial [Lysobacterales bacterium]